MATINGTTGNDALIGTSGDDSIYGDAGDDYLRGDAGNDHLDGGDGIDRAAYYGALGGVTVDLAITGPQDTVNAGTDTLVNIEDLSGSSYSDTLYGNDGDNWIWGGAAATGISQNDHIYARGGNDLVEVGAGKTIVDGGTGTDTLWFYGNGTDISSAGVAFSLAHQGTSQNTRQGTMIATNFENVSGSIYDDALTGNAAANVLAGDAGNDTLNGSGGNDTLYGDGQISFDAHGLNPGLAGPITTFPDISVLGDPPGNDVLNGGTGADALFGGGGDDMLDGGAGNDTLDGGDGFDMGSYASATAAVSVSLAVAGAQSTGGSGTDSLTSIEGLIGSAYADHLTGDANANQLTGGNGDDVLTAGAGNDGVDGGDGNDQLLGGDGHDSMVGGTGDDSLSGGAGDDYLRGDAGNDYLDGGTGFDRAAYYLAPGGVTVDLAITGAQDTGNAGIDTLVNIENLSGSSYSDTLYGNDGSNWIWGGALTSGIDQNDTIYARGGNDLVEVGAGNNVVDGGTGIDTLWLIGNGADISSDGVAFSLALQGSAQDTRQGMMTASNFENLSGSLYDDALTGNAGANILAGDQGNDTLTGGAGNDMLYGDGQYSYNTHGIDPGLSGPITLYPDMGIFGVPPGNDTLLGGAGADGLYGGGGDDTLDGGAGNDTIDGGDGTDTAQYASASAAVTVSLAVTGAQNTVGAGTDTLTNIENVSGSNYADHLTGDANRNVLTGGNGADVLTGGAGNDTLDGGAANDQLHGGDDHDLLIGGAGADALYGDGGDDYLHGDAGDDYIDGGDGVDRAGYVGAIGGVTVDLRIAGAQNTVHAGNDTLVNIENLSGSAYSDTLYGNDGDNWIWGGGAVSGISQNDTISAFGGNDLVEVGAGNNIVDGGAGNDTLRLFGNGADISSDGVAFSLGLQGSAQDTRQGMMTATNFENVSGSLYDDALTGNDTANILAGDQGNDTLIGGAGNDALYGDGQYSFNTHGIYPAFSGPITLYPDMGIFGVPAGNDTLEGGAGSDTLNGGGGDDTIDGGSGRDALTGGTGADDFLFRAGDTSNINSTSDLIKDFSSTDADKIDLHLVDANSLVSGDQDFTFIGTDAFDGHTAGELRYQVISGVTYVSADMNGDGAVDMMIRLSGSHVLTQADFIL